MEYKFATEHSNYADLASGNVFYSLPGHPAFPVRLASEIYQRCQALRGNGSLPCTIYDPCCGAAYHLSTISYLHWDSICRVICSDIDEKAVQVAERNLGLLTPDGMERRSREISAMIRLYDKESHKGALESIVRNFGYYYGKEKNVRVNSVSQSPTKTSAAQRPAKILPALRH